jgi:hypothetical protein
MSVSDLGPWRWDEKPNCAQATARLRAHASEVNRKQRVSPGRLTGSLRAVFARGLGVAEAVNTKVAAIVKRIKQTKPLEMCWIAYTGPCEPLGGLALSQLGQG